MLAVISMESKHPQCQRTEVKMSATLNTGQKESANTVRSKIPTAVFCKWRCNHLQAMLWWGKLTWPLPLQSSLEKPSNYHRLYYSRHALTLGGPWRCETPGVDVMSGVSEEFLKHARGFQENLLFFLNKRGGSPSSWSSFSGGPRSYVSQVISNARQTCGPHAHPLR